MISIVPEIIKWKTFSFSSTTSVGGHMCPEVIRVQADKSYVNRRFEHDIVTLYFIFADVMEKEIIFFIKLSDE